MSFQIAKALMRAKRPDLAKLVVRATLLDPGADDAAIIVSQKFAAARNNASMKGKKASLPAVISRETKRWKGRITVDDVTRHYIALVAPSVKKAQDREQEAEHYGLLTLKDPVYKKIVKSLIQTGSLPSGFIAEKKKESTVDTYFRDARQEEFLELIHKGLKIPHKMSAHTIELKTGKPNVSITLSVVPHPNVETKENGETFSNDLGSAATPKDAILALEQAFDTFAL